MEPTGGVSKILKCSSGPDLTIHKVLNSHDKYREIDVFF